MIETLDDTTHTYSPGGVRLSHAKLKRLQPELYTPSSKWIWWRRTSYWLALFEWQLYYGESRAAVVVSTKPLLVAAYAAEIDCVALLRFDDSLVSEYGLEVGSRLITVNVYYDLEDSTYESDLIPGPATTGRSGNFSPLIADFLTHDTDRLAELKAEISADEWFRTETLGQTYLTENYAQPRDGRPFWSLQPATKSEAPPLREELPYDRRVAQQEAIKRIFFLLFFALITFLALRDFRPNSLQTWLPVLVFGSFLVVTMVGVLRLPRDVERKTIRGKRWSIKLVYMGAGTFVGALLLGLFSELLVSPRFGAWPKLAVWLVTFLSTAAFYPFLDRETNENVQSFRVWTIWSAILGFISLLVWQFLRWIYN